MTDKLIEAIKALYEIPGCDNPDKGHGALVFGVEAIAKATIATLTAEREELISLIEQYGTAIVEGDNVVGHREAMFLAVRPQLKETQDD